MQSAPRLPDGEFLIDAKSRKPANDLWVITASDEVPFTSETKVYWSRDEVDAMCAAKNGARPDFADLPDYVVVSLAAIVDEHVKQSLESIEPIAEGFLTRWFRRWQKPKRHSHFR